MATAKKQVVTGVRLTPTLKTKVEKQARRERRSQQMMLLLLIERGLDVTETRPST